MTDPPPFPDSLCHRCHHLRVIRSARGSGFLMCQEPSLPKYTAQPVRSCPRFAPAGSAGPLEDEARDQGPAAIRDSAVSEGRKK